MTHQKALETANHIGVDKLRLSIKEYITQQQQFTNDVNRFIELYSNTNECNEITYMYAITQIQLDETPRDCMHRLDLEYKLLLEKIKQNNV